MYLDIIYLGAYQNVKMNSYETEAASCGAIIHLSSNCLSKGYVIHYRCRV
jgi:hypothetical protein